jgi:CheY-like chemotaxis protein
MSKLVLVVDDDDTAIRRHKSVLEEYDIVVVSATTLERAVVLYKEYAGKLSAIIVDGCVPGNVLNSIPFIELVLEDSFRGFLVAASGSASYRKIMVASGCHHQSNKYSAADMVVQLLQ